MVNKTIEINKGEEMNCKKCNTYQINTVEVINTLNKKTLWLCFSCWAISKKNYKLSSTKL